jgi:hypothetical protein
MSEVLFNPINVFWLAIVAMVCVPFGLEYWRKVRKDELDASLKHEMIARGMSADEIERVLAAKTSK